MKAWRSEIDGVVYIDGAGMDSVAQAGTGAVPVPESSSR